MLAAPGRLLHHVHIGLTSGALQERRARQHRVMQQLFNSQRKRAAGTRARIQDRGRQGGYDPDRWTSYECDRFRDRFRGERLDGFLAGDEHHGKRRVHKMMQNLATEVRDQVDARSPVRPDEVKRSQSVEIIADTPPAVADLEQRAERVKLRFFSLRAVTQLVVLLLLIYIDHVGLRIVYTVYTYS
ncbi:hypothetical protein GCK32_008170 [Trichostrongylus colubriformis]|uniref:Uncharacterized protein n=1 Tax=Trichostrongylus colubriformis TaxID=6319 RepID=A0AAN8IRM3_TRICO